MSRAEVREVKRREKESKRADARTRKARQKKEKKARREQWLRDHPKTVAFLKNRKIRLAVIITIAILIHSVLSFYALVLVSYLSIPRIERLNAELDNIVATSKSFMGQVKTSSGTRVVLLATDGIGGRYHYLGVTVYESARGRAETKDIWGLSGTYDYQIFYDDVWQYSASSVTKLETAHGTEAIIFIVPPADYDFAFYDKAFSENTEFYDIAPYDTMGNEFIAYYPPETEYPGNTYPMWMIILSCEDLPEDYELHYGHFVLTAQDIQKGTWTPPSEK